MPELGGGLITRGIAGNDLHCSIRRRIILQSEKREADAFLALHGISGEEMRTDLNAGNLCIVGYAVDDTLRSTLIDVVLSGKHLQPRRLDLECKISGDVSAVSLEKATQGIVDGDDVQGSRAGFHLEFVRHQFADVVSSRFFRPGTIKGIVGKYHFLILLFQPNAHVP